MVGEWRATTLGELADFLSGGTPSKDRSDYWTGSIPWVSAKDMKRFRLDDTEDHVSQEGVANGTRLVPGESVLLLARGMTLLNDVPICVISQPMSFNQDVKALRPKAHVCSKYLPYLILGNRDRLLSLVDLAGHGTGRLNSDELKALDVALPPLDEQRAIAHILGTLDDKIELNRRMSATLEAMARALFKSWFVDFDPVRAKAEGRDPGLPPNVAALFPERLGDDGLPEGWSRKPLLDYSRLISGGTPKTGVAEYWNGSIRWASARDVSQCGAAFLITTERSITERGLSESSARIVPKLATVVVARGATTGRFCMFGDAIAMNQTCYALASSQQRPFWLNCAFAAEVDALVHAAHGSTFDTITTRTIEQARVPVSHGQVEDRFETLVHPLFMCVLRIMEESRTLAALRDTLLPKLVSGELRVTAAEKIISKVA